MKSAPPINGRPNRDQAMLVMYQNGSTVAEVGAEFGLSPQRVYQILVAMECKMRRSGPRSWTA